MDLDGNIHVQMSLRANIETDDEGQIETYFDLLDFRPPPPVTTLIDFYPRREDTGWRCRFCCHALPMDPLCVAIEDSPLWHIEATTELAEAAADEHLRDVHGVTRVRR